MHTILIVEDDETTRLTMCEILKAHDFLILEAENGRDLFDILDTYPLDLILLDLMLPDGNGIDFLHQIRDQSNVPVIIVSGDRSNKRKVIGLDCGADDYVVKPFDAEVLVARIRANLRRFDSTAYNGSFINHDNENVDVIKFGQWVFDEAQSQIFDEHGISGNLTLQEFRMLSKLIHRAGDAVQHYELCECVGEDEYILNRHVIDIKIAEVRKKVGDSEHSPVFIKTVSGVGYVIDKNHISNVMNAT